MIAISTVIVPYEGLLDLCQLMLGPVQGNITYLVDLFANQAIPSEYSTFADFTLCSFEGYSTIPISSAAFLKPVLTAGYSYSAYANSPVSWSNNSNSPAYAWGFLVRNASTNHVLWAQQWDAVYVLNTNCVLSLPLFLNVYPYVTFVPPIPP